MTPEIVPAPAPDEAAAIVAVLAGSAGDPAPEPAKPSRWRMAGRNYGWKTP